MSLDLRKRTADVQRAGDGNAVMTLYIQVSRTGLINLIIKEKVEVR